MSREEYEAFTYLIADHSEHVQYYDLVIIPIGKSLGIAKGTIHFAKSIRLEIREALDFALEEWITGYSYAVYFQDAKKYWYDSQGHPDDPDLQSAHPHHKHIPPDIKHHRIPAPQLSFRKENLSVLIHEIETEFF
jgi:hypothetical protein